MALTKTSVHQHHHVRHNGLIFSGVLSICHPGEFNTGVHLINKELAMALMEPRIKNPLIKISATIIATWLLAHGSLANAETALGRLERTLAEDSQITQVSSGYVMRVLSDNSSTILLFDVRKQDEFLVSHLSGAIRLDPDTTAEQFVRDYGQRLEGTTPIFYCSVGRRSNAMAEAIAAHTREQPIPIVPVNLRGGIFRWHNEDKPLQDAQGPTDQIHPYSWWWQRMLNHPERSAYAPAIPANVANPTDRQQTHH
ncbi:MAG: rhodanese-related sulfurtransferase [Candidatus Pseudothioglobus sp.]|jgi:rhodanese-related sulfurtransferase